MALILIEKLKLHIVTIDEVDDKEKGPQQKGRSCMSKKGDQEN